ncbi:unnamed protein product [Calicophoron daubneyi]|uniref:ethanolamine kinase n=1 Tax=Calicophoron daubneyi TaxID=300641 RepID=A0AAV2T990_CALDB
MVDRNFEILCMNAFNQHHSSQKLHAIFRNGISYSYVDGFTLPVSHMGTEKYARLIGDELAHFHSLPIETILRQPGLRDALFVHAGRAQTIPTLFPRLRDWISGLPADLPNPQESVLYQTRFPTPEQLLCEVEFLEKLLHDPCSPVVLCHGDLLSGNIIVSPDKSSVTFIDLEFCGFNHAAFDIGNHFCEYAGIGNVDYSKYPSPSFQREWIKFYLKCLRKYRSMAVNGQSDHGDDEDPDDQEVNRWIREVGYFALAAHLHWGIWAAIRAKDGLSGFDYLAYAIKRLDQYYLMKKRILHADGLTQ